MMLDYELTTRAVKDLAAARDWYDRINVELADRLLNEVQSAIRIICEHPTRFPEYGIHSHAIRCPTFPYRVIYEIHPARIIVKAVYHTSRDPARWDDSARE